MRPWVTTNPNDALQAPGRPNRGQQEKPAHMDQAVEAAACCGGLFRFKSRPPNLLHLDMGKPRTPAHPLPDTVLQPPQDDVEKALTDIIAGLPFLASYAIHEGSSAKSLVFDTTGLDIDITEQIQTHCTDGPMVAQGTSETLSGSTWRGITIAPEPMLTL